MPIIYHYFILYDRPLKTGFCVIGRGHSVTRWEIKYIGADVSITNAFDHFFWLTEFYCSIVFYFYFFHIQLPMLSSQYYRNNIAALDSV